MIFGNSDDLLHHLWYLHVDDLCNDSFRDMLLWNVVNNDNGLLGDLKNWYVHDLQSTVCCQRHVSGIISSTSSSVNFLLLRLSGQRHVSLGMQSHLHASAAFAS